MGFILDMIKRSRNSRSYAKEREKAERKQEKLNASLPRLIARTDSPGLLYRYYSQTRDSGLRFMIFNKLARSAPSMAFGGIDWIILKEEEGRKLLLTKYLPLDRLPYARGLKSTRRYEGESWYVTYPDLHWYSSRLRAYLNEDFYDAFSEEEKSRILPVHIAPDSEEAVCLNSAAEAGAFSSSEVNQVFILSKTEVLEYSGKSFAARFCFDSEGQESAIWTRTPSMQDSIEHGIWKSTAFCFCAGDHPDQAPCFTTPAFDELHAVRPAIWISCP